MSTVMLEDADSQLAQLVQQATNGEEVIIVHDSKPIAKLVPLPETDPKPRRPGYGCGKDDILYMADDFDASLEDFRNYVASTVGTFQPRNSFRGSYSCDFYIL